MKPKSFVIAAVAALALASLGLVARRLDRVITSPELRQTATHPMQYYVSLPTGWTNTDWIMYWTQPDDGTTPPATYTHDYYAVAATLDSTGAITYTDGTIGFDDSGDYQYTPSNTATGSFVTGPNGRIEVDAPLSDVGLASGTQMGTVGGATDEGDPVTGLITDTAAGSGSWTLGTTSCLG